MDTQWYAASSSGASSKTLLAHEFFMKNSKTSKQCLCEQDVLGQPPETVSKITFRYRCYTCTRVLHVSRGLQIRHERIVAVWAAEDAMHRAPHHVERCALPTTWREAHARRARTTPRMRATAYRTLMPKLMHHACATIQDTRVLRRHRMHEGNECRASPTYCVDNAQHV